MATPRLDDATTAADRAMLDERIAAAAAHHEAGRVCDAESAFREALSLSPRHAAILHNLGAIAAARDDVRAAIGYFDDAIAAEPRYVLAHFNRAALQKAKGRRAEAIAGFERVCALEPENYEAHRALGLLFLAEGKRGRSLDHFARTYELRRGEDRTRLANKTLTCATRGKLRHDAEQFHFLSGRRRNEARFAAMSRNYAEVANEISDDVTPLSGRQLDRLGEDYNCAIHMADAPQLAAGAVCSRSDRDLIMSRFETDGVACFDDLLTEPALRVLKRHVLESTIWHDFLHIPGFVASYLEEGLACPLLLQVVDQIRRTFPDLLGDMPLSQAWAFKGLDADAAIDAHADDGSISVNFWLTPDEANLDGGRGGLAVCRTPPPSDWSIAHYEADKARVAEFMDRHSDQVLYAPYRENRAVLFKSRLFHRSDAPAFATGYENHRVNMTLLFDHGGAA